MERRGSKEDKRKKGESRGKEDVEAKEEDNKIERKGNSVHE